MKLIAGLGNPGKKYEHTRHNAGFMALDAIAAANGFPPFSKTEKHRAEWSEGMIAKEKTILLKPQTFMNLSGESVRSVMDFYRLKPEDLMVIHDDADLPLGTVRIRPNGSSGGHNGLKSLIAHLGTENFTRIRIGIGRPENPEIPLEDYVLGAWTKKEKEELAPVFEEIITYLGKPQKS